jgi:voltage-gated sodium channel
MANTSISFGLVNVPVKRSSFLDKAVLAAIIGNSLLLLWGLVDKHHQDLIGTVDEILLWFFALEIAIRLKTAGRRFLHDKWLLFDAACVLVALAPVGVNLIALRVVRACRIAHFGRHLAHVRHVLSLRLFGWLAHRRQPA